MAPPLKVLIADDDRVTVEALAAALRVHRVRVVAAVDAMQAFMYAVRELPDAIILDIGMPGGTGMSALQKIRSNVKTSQIPVLVITGLEDPKLPDQVRELGAEFRRKPMPPADVFPLIRELVSGDGTG